ncbi:ketopantoate reductase family protein [Mucilaginibacter sp. 14171R-50]|uniref:ketopantoate reductase family protein n=1 Tax=Mucilaginibacter sp. 14171R-50 TaxID=2703789 RepID=UPI00192E90D9|nr:2-dehydropantoate 2-reductase [Mucilaginibacter sp. 14171R-50]
MIYIIGAGAIGQALAVLLQNTGKEVVLVKSRQVQETQRDFQAIHVHVSGQLSQAAVKVASLATISFESGLILVTAKSFANSTIAAKLRGANQPVILLQNGLNIEQPFIDQHIRQLYRCVLLVTAQFNADGTVRFKPVSACPVGLVQGEQGMLDELVGQLDNPWFRFRSEQNIQPLIWKKVIANCVFNSICPLLDIDNGIFYKNEFALRMARNVIHECLAVAERQGVALSAQEVEDSLLSISRMSDGQFISTLQDIRNHRPTEIATLNAEIVSLAGDLPVPYTKLLGELTALKSQLNLL